MLISQVKLDHTSKDGSKIVEVELFPIQIGLGWPHTIHFYWKKLNFDDLKKINNAISEFWYVFLKGWVCEKVVATTSLTTITIMSVIVNMARGGR